MNNPSLQALAADIAACVSFYTRLPVPSGTIRGCGFAAAQWAAPVAGLVVGLAVGVVLWLALELGVPATIAAALALCAGVTLTGALHEDGLADAADGLGGGLGREAKLEIMKDSRLGSYGGLALILSLLTRWAALAAIAALPPPTMLLGVMAAHAASRATIPALMARLPAARPDGLSAGVGAVEPRIALGAGAIGAAALLLSGLAFALVATALLACIVLSAERLAMRQIGGQTGDVLGALQQAAEIAVLVAAATMLLPG